MNIITGSNYEEIINSDKVVFVDYYADWCGPCKMMGPIVEELAEEYAGKAAFAKCNIDDNMGIAQQNRIMSIPTFIIYKDGKPVDAIIGGCAKSELAAKIDAQL